MKKAIFVIGAVVILSLGLVGVALADNGPHGNYTDLTDKCAGCHRGHTGLGASLLKSPATTNDKSAFCYSCHNGLGAYTNVQNGIFASVSPPPPDENTDPTTAGTPLKGGGFEQVKMNISLGASPVVTTTTSKHEVTGGSNTVWGYGPVTPAVDLGAANVALTCTNCHNPHGGAGTGNTATYRLLKGGSANNTPLFANDAITLSATVDVPEEFDGHLYGIDSRNPMGRGRAPFSYFGQHGPTSDSPNEDIDIYASMTAWCSQCHTRYNAPMTGNPATSASGDAVFQYRHGLNSNASSDCSTSCHVNGIPGLTPGATLPDAAPNPSCITCHVAHGTGARMDTYSGSVPWPGGATTPNGNARSSLLRLNNRGICEYCHVK